MRAFTLFEILVSVTLTAVIAVGLLSFYDISDMSWQYEKTLLDLQQQARIGLDIMTREMRYGSASTINIPVSLNSLTFTPVDTANPVTYSLSGSQLRRSCAGVNKTLASEISYLSFCCVHGSSCDNVCSGSNEVRINLKAGDIVKQRSLSAPMESLVIFRND